MGMVLGERVNLSWRRRAVGGVGAAKERRDGQDSRGAKRGAGHGFDQSTAATHTY